MSEKNSKKLKIWISNCGNTDYRENKPFVFYQLRPLLPPIMQKMGKWRKRILGTRINMWQHWLPNIEKFFKLVMEIIIERKNGEKIVLMISSYQGWLPWGFIWSRSRLNRAIDFEMSKIEDLQKTLGTSLDLREGSTDGVVYLYLTIDIITEYHLQEKKIFSKRYTFLFNRNRMIPRNDIVLKFVKITDSTKHDWIVRFCESKMIV